MSKYTYNPYSEEPILSSIAMLLVIKRHWDEFVKLMDYIAVNQIPVWANLDEFEPMFSYAEILIYEMRLAAHSYYDLWILRHLLRVAVFYGLNYDIKQLYG